MARHLTVALISLTLSISLLAETLPHTFADGEVIFADQINENFQFVLENGGCSVEQIEEGAVIRCGDGSEAVIAGAGRVIAYPHGNFSGGTVTSIGTGDIVLKDADGILIGKISSANGNSYEIEVLLPEPGEIRFISIVNELDSSTLSIVADRYVLYSELDCTGQAFSSPVTIAEGADGQYLAVKDRTPIFTVAKSVFFYGNCSNSETIRGLYPAYPFTLPDAILNASFPVSAHQE